MAERRILQLGDPRLWQMCEPVADFAAPQLAQVIQDLDDTLAGFRMRTDFGRGIAAPQIGMLLRVVVVRIQPTGFCGPLINPRIVSRSERQIEIWDNCFSFPDLVVRVRRAAEIRVQYADHSGAYHSIEAAGDLSELLQHEIDHLDGMLATDRVIGPRAFMTRAEWERIGRP